MTTNRRLATGMPAAASRNPLPKLPACEAARKWGAVVLTLRLAYPAPVTEAGLKLQVLSLGSPVQEPEEKLIVPL